MTNYDGPWKDAFDDFCPAALELLFPVVHAHVDWERNFEFLDTELRQIVPEAEWGKGIVDKLIKVWLKSGEEKWLLLHLEFQAQAESGFGLRMFAYHSAIFLRYNQQVVSLAILGDDQPNWRPSEYRAEQWGCELNFRFPIVKLLDWLPRAAELQASRNPVAHVVLAHLRALQTHKQMDNRRVYKFELVRNLYELGFEAEVIRKLFRLIDWMMVLPADLDELFNGDLQKLEEEKNMPYVTSIERRALQRGRFEGKEEGREQGIIEAYLEFKFGEAGKILCAEIQKIENIDRLRKLAADIKQAPTLEEARRLIQQPAFRA